MSATPKDTDRWLLRGALVLQWEPAQVMEVDLRIAGGLIAEIAPSLEAQDGEEVLDLNGRWLAPGLVCGHTHLYSALSCGMPMLDDVPISFGDMLAKVWWRMDEALDEEAVEVSALVGGAAALRAGVTTLIDHHASPNAIDNSLILLEKALGTLGLRRVLCYEVTDRGGAERAAAGLRAHERLLSEASAAHDEGMCGTLIGAHANFTLSDDTLQCCADLAKEADVGLHIHVAEAVDDAIVTGENPVKRLERLGALRPGSILAHCVHTSPDDLRRIRDAGAWIAHQPRSNMNNAVGYAPVSAFADAESNAMLGTDGIGADMFAELQSAWYRGQEAGVGWAPQDWLRALSRGAIFARQALKNAPQLGAIAVGAAADLVVLDPVPGPPLRAANLAAAMVFRMSAAQVRHVMVRGRWRLWERELAGMSSAALDQRAQRVAQSLWDRMA